MSRHRIWGQLWQNSSGVETPFIAASRWRLALLACGWLGAGVTSVPLAGQETAIAAGKAESGMVEEVSPPEVIGRGPHHRVIQRVVAEPGPDGQRRTRVSRYTELATGLHRAVEDGQGGVTWVETEEKFELVPGGAVARGQHTVRINGDFLAGDVVDLELGGHRFRSRLLGLALTDQSSGQSVLIAEPQACEGELTAPNVILFRDALAGPVRCDVRFTFTRAGFAQDVICRTRVPDPKDLGLDPVWTRIEVWTVLDALEPTGRETRLAKPEEAGLPMFDAGMSDETVH